MLVDVPVESLSFFIFWPKEGILWNISKGVRDAGRKTSGRVNVMYALP